MVILTKTHATTTEQMRADLDRFRLEIGTDYLDIVLLHLITEEDWPRRKAGAMEVLSRAREAGQLRSHGVSCHTIEALRTAAATPWTPVDLARINPEGVEMDADPGTVISVLCRMKAAGKGIIGIKILGAGRLRDHVDDCLQVALGLDCVDCFTIGQESAARFQDLVRRIPMASARGSRGSHRGNRGEPPGSAG